MEAKAYLKLQLDMYTKDNWPQLELYTRIKLADCQKRTLDYSEYVNSLFALLANNILTPSQLDYYKKELCNLGTKSLPKNRTMVSLYNTL